MSNDLDKIQCVSFKIQAVLIEHIFTWSPFDFSTASVSSQNRSSAGAGAHFDPHWAFSIQNENWIKDLLWFITEGSLSWLNHALALSIKHRTALLWFASFIISHTGVLGKFLKNQLSLSTLQIKRQRQRNMTEKKTQQQNTTQVDINW